VNGRVTALERENLPNPLEDLISRSAAPHSMVRSGGWNGEHGEGARDAFSEKESIQSE
jgi:hypothetical protein